MNFKTMLLTTAAVSMIAGVANAKDFTGSLFLPAKGELLSNTSIDHSRLKDKYVARVREKHLNGKKIYLDKLNRSNRWEDY